MKKCIGMSKEFAEEWNKTAPSEGQFIYIEDDEKFGWVMMRPKMESEDGGWC